MGEETEEQRKKRKSQAEQQAEEQKQREYGMDPEKLKKFQQGSVFNPEGKPQKK